jgi:uncharacterized membrane protein YbhN (UPF0104 family)
MMTPSDHGRAPVATSILVERLSGFAVMLAISVVALATLPLELGASRPLGILVVAALTAVVLGVLYAPGRLLAVLLLVERVLPHFLRRPFVRLHRLTAGLFGPGSDPRSVTQALVWSVPFYGAMMLAQYFMLRAVGADPGALAVILGAPLISLVSLTPVTINGLFLAEGAFVLVYASAGVPAEVALAAAIVRRLVDLANSGLGSGMWLAWQLGLRGATWPGRSEEHGEVAALTARG